MNKTEKMWVAVLVALLIGYLAWQWMRPTPPPAPAPAPVAQQQTSVNTNKAASIAPTAPVQKPAEAPVALPKGEDVVLENDQVKLTFNTLGARLVSAEMKQYKAENTEESGPVVLTTGDLLELSFGEAWPKGYTVEAEGQTLHFTTTLENGVTLKRSVTLENDYKLTVKDAFSSATPATINAYRFNGGTLSLLPKDELGADFLAQGERKPEYLAGTLPKILGAGSAFLGCGTSSDAAGTRESAQQAFPAQTWVALKNRFFVSLVQPQTACPADLRVAREKGDRLVVNRVGADFSYPAIALGAGQTQEVWTTLYVGPKKLSSLNAFGNHADRVMDFGFFTWVCEILLPLLNGFYWIIPNYGVAIILLTLVVRMVFWPLTHKSTVSMRKMSIIQPMIKDLQKQFKDNPQKLQQETFKLYREHKVNPFSSCLPLLIQIPIFIALFTVLRSAVELRFESFLWIRDLSQPENLFAGILPVPLNILPILTAITMGLQTHLSPSTGDPAQKKMMTWMMPIMMLFFFYSMASALCLYWTVSQAMSIFQMWHIQRQVRKQTEAKA